MTKTRVGPKIENPDNLGDVVRNIIIQLEHPPYVIKERDDLVNQALLALLTLIEREQDRRHALEAERGPRIGG
jgi:uncharacterized membrane protein